MASCTRLQLGAALAANLLSARARATAFKRDSFDDQFSDAQRTVKIGQGVIIGIAIGSVVLFIIGCVVAYFCVARTRRRRRAIAQDFGETKPGAALYGGQAFGASPYAVPAPQPAPSGGLREQSVYAQQQAMLNMYTRPANGDEEARRPLLGSEPAQPALVQPAPAHFASRGGTLEVPPPAYDVSPSSSAAPSPSTSPLPLPSSSLSPLDVQEEPLASPSPGERRGREVRREEKRGVVLEYVANQAQDRP